MFAIIGIVVVFGCIVAGYLMEHGNIRVLLQPAELLIIGGAAAGTVLIANPVHVLKQIAGGLASVFGSSRYTRQRYIETLKMMFDLLNKARREGLVALESDIEEPGKSPLFSKYKDFMNQHHAVSFVCDTMRMAVSGGVEVFDLDQMLESDMEVHHHDASEPVTALSTTADPLPGLGIVAAVLGVVITMGALGGPPEEIGRKVAAALVGTFLGVLLCYGLVGPLAARLGKAADEERAYMQVLRAVMIAFLKGIAPIMAVEIGRRAVPGHLRPSFTEVEKACRSGSFYRLSPMNATPIIIKRKAAHAGHHGGAWKVAYADFVTAMMALFIVLWLMNSSKQIQVAVGGYFKDPTGKSKQVGSDMSGSGESFKLTKNDLSKLKEQLQKHIQSITELEMLHKNIEMTVTAEGLRIELLESEKGTFFDRGSSGLNASGKELLVLLAQQLGQLPNRISVEGHTDAKPYVGNGNYTNWELSADRANAARRLMQQSGLRSDQISQVRGFADQRLRTPQDPLEPSNRRISIIVQYLGSESDSEGSSPATAKESKKE